MDVTVRDGDDAVALERPTRLAPSEMRETRRIDVTPDSSTSVGPYQVEISIDSDVHSLSFRTSERFAQPCTEIPLSSFEHGDPTMWFVAEGMPQHYVTGGYYYSQHLTDQAHRDYPQLAYDLKQKHSGRQSLRIGYEPGREAYAWSRQELPGKPSMLGMWVHGNESGDELIIRFEDHINFAQPGYSRNANFSQATVCKLDFAGWRRFQVPVLGDGMQITGIKGSSPEIDAPVKIMALLVKSVKPKPPAKPADPAAAPPEPAPPETRQIWVDDISVQTQIVETGAAIARNSRQPSRWLALRRCRAAGQRRQRPRRRLAARQTESFGPAMREGQAVWTQTVDLPAKADQFSAAEVPLKDLATRAASGPIDIDVTFTDPTVAGARITRPPDLETGPTSGPGVRFRTARRLQRLSTGRHIAGWQHDAADGNSLASESRQWRRPKARRTRWPCRSIRSK